MCLEKVESGGGKEEKNDVVVRFHATIGGSFKVNPPSRKKQLIGFNQSVLERRVRKNTCVSTSHKTKRKEKAAE